MKKFAGLVSTTLTLMLAASVTAGTMFVTVQAKVNQDAVVPDQAPDALPQSADSVTEAIQAIEEQDLSKLLDRPVALKPEEIVHDRSEQIVINADGDLNGRLSTLDSSNGDLSPAASFAVRIIQGGKTIATATTDESGSFSVTGIPSGVCAIMAEGESGFLVFGFRAAKKGDPGVPEDAEVAELGLDSTVVTGADAGLARELIRSALVSEDVRFGVEMEEGDDAFSFGSGPSSTSLSFHRVQLREDGTLEGEVNVLDPRTGKFREVLDMTVHFLREGKEVIAAEVSNDGKFVVAGLTTGVYSFVGTGQDGVFAIAVDVVSSAYEPDADPIRNAGVLKPAAIAQSLVLSISPGGPGNVNTNTFEPGNGNGDGGPGSPPPTPPSPGGGAMGGNGGGFSGTGGGGGAVGGGGGLGGLLAGIAGGVAGYLAGQDDDPSSPGN